jgi:phosphoribosyl-AMP cyclohydrolase
VLGRRRLLAGPAGPHPPVASRRAALAAALDARVAPPGYRDDLLRCLAPEGRPGAAAEVHAAACRLAVGIVELLASHAGAFDGLLPAELAAALADGSLRRHVAELAATLPP